MKTSAKNFGVVVGP